MGGEGVDLVEGYPARYETGVGIESISLNWGKMEMAFESVFTIALLVRTPSLLFGLLFWIL